MCIRDRHRDHAIFGQTLLNSQHSVGRGTRKSPIKKWANALKESSKKLTEAEWSFSQHHQLVHWYRWVPRTPTWCRKTVLQGACPPEDSSFRGGAPPGISMGSQLTNSLNFSLSVRPSCTHMLPFLAWLIPSQIQRPIFKSTFHLSSSPPPCPGLENLQPEWAHQATVHHFTLILSPNGWE